MRTITWQDERKVVQMIDQRILPREFELLDFDHYTEVAKAITTMVIRGAPAIGAAAAFGMALAGFNSDARTIEELQSDLSEAGETLNKARPTAVNLSWAVRQMLDRKSVV